MSQLGYKNLEIVEFLHGLFIGSSYQKSKQVGYGLSLKQIYQILNSYAILAPEKTEYLIDFIP